MYVGLVGLVGGDVVVVETSVVIDTLKYDDVVVVIVVVGLLVSGAIGVVCG